MKTLKLVIGILCIILSAFILFQSCAAGVANTMEESGEVSGSAGLLVAILMLAGGIVMIAARNSIKKAGDIAGAILFVLAALIGFTCAGTFSDLKIWSGLCVIIALILMISATKKKKPPTDTDISSTQK